MLRYRETQRRNFRFAQNRWYAPTVYRAPRAPDYVRRQAANAYRDVIRSLEDRRLWTPDPYLPAAPASWTRAARRQVIAESPAANLSSGLYTPSAAVGFAEPKKVSICVRRHVRREVLLATGKGGRNRRGKRNWWSDVQC